MIATQRVGAKEVLALAQALLVDAHALGDDAFDVSSRRVGSGCTRNRVQLSSCASKRTRLADAGYDVLERLDEPARVTLRRRPRPGSRPTAFSAWSVGERARRVDAILVVTKPRSATAS